MGLEGINCDKLAGLRNYAILAVALSTGRRSSELVGLRAKDLKITSITRQKPEPRITLTFRCKGHTSLRDTLDAETSAVVLDYLHVQYGQHLLTTISKRLSWLLHVNFKPLMVAVTIKDVVNYARLRFITFDWSR